MLEFAEAALDLVALSIEIVIIISLHFAVASRWNDCFCACRLDMLDQHIGIVSLIRDDGLSRAVAQQGDSLGTVGHLSGGDVEAQRQAQFVGQQVDLGRQTTSGTPQSLVCAPFLRPVAAC